MKLEHRISDLLENCFWKTLRLSGPRFLRRRLSCCGGLYLSCISAISWEAVASAVGFPERTYVSCGRPRLVPPTDASSGWRQAVQAASGAALGPLGDHLVLAVLNLIGLDYHNIVKALPGSRRETAVSTALRSVPGQPKVWHSNDTAALVA